MQPCKTSLLAWVLASSAVALAVLSVALQSRPAHAKVSSPDYEITEYVLGESYTPDKIVPPAGTLVAAYAFAKKPKEGSNFHTVSTLYIREWEEKHAEVKVVESTDSLLVDMNGSTVAGVAVSVQGLRALLEHRSMIRSITIGYKLDAASVELLKLFASLRYIYEQDGVEDAASYRSFIYTSLVVYSHWFSGIAVRQDEAQIRSAYRIELLVTDGTNDLDRLGTAEPVSLMLRIGCKDIEDTVLALERLPASVRYLTLELWDHYSDWQAIARALKRYSRLVSLCVLFCGDYKGIIPSDRPISLADLPPLQAISFSILKPTKGLGKATLPELMYSDYHDDGDAYIRGALALDSMTAATTYLSIRRMSVECTDLSLLKLREFRASACQFDTANFGLTGVADVAFLNVAWGYVSVAGTAETKLSVVSRLVLRAQAIEHIDSLALRFPDLPRFERLVEASISITDKSWTIPEEFVKKHLLKIRLYAYFRFSGLSADATALEVVEQLTSTYFAFRNPPVRTVGSKVFVLYEGPMMYYPHYAPDVSELRGKD